MSYRRIRFPLAAWIFVAGLWVLLLWVIGGNVVSLWRWVVG